MSKHTPGPWTAVELQNRDGISHGIISEHPSVGYWHIAETGTHDGRKYAAANARLIAAAPDLLEAIELLTEYFSESHLDEINHNHYGDGPEGCTYCRAIAQARAAIEKARGE